MTNQRAVFDVFLARALGLFVKLVFIIEYASLALGIRALYLLALGLYLLSAVALRKQGVNAAPCQRLLSRQYSEVKFRLPKWQVLRKPFC